MTLTAYGFMWFKGLRVIPPPDDFIVVRHNEASYAVVHYAHKDRPVALHAGSSAETHRLFKLLLITRRLKS